MTVYNKAKDHQLLTYEHIKTGTAKKTVVKCFYKTRV